MSQGNLAETFTPPVQKTPESVSQTAEASVQRESKPRRYTAAEELMRQEINKQQHRTGRPRDGKEVPDVVREYHEVTRFDRNKLAVLSYPYGLIRDRFNDREQRELVKKAGIDEALSQERFDIVAGILQHSTNLERMYFRARAGALPQLFRQFNTTITSLIEDGRVHAAADLLRCREIILGPLSVDEPIRALFEAHKHQQSLPVQSSEILHQSHETALQTPDTMVSFYTDEYLRMALTTLRSATDFNARAPSSLRLALARFDEQLNLRTQALLRRTRRYLLYAVQTELDFQNPKGLPVFKSELAHVGYGGYGVRESFAPFFQNREDVLDFLAASRGRFEKGFKIKGYGGKPWAKIAEVGYEAWKTDDLTKAIPIIDRMFQLEHNTGTVLNKDFREFTNAYQARTVLDAKFKAKDLGELYSETKVFILSSDELLKTLTTRMTALEEILKLAQTYFPQEVQQVRTQLNLSLEDLMKTEKLAKHRRELIKEWMPGE